MAACKTLTTASRTCGKTSRAGVSPDVYLIAYDDLVKVAGTTEVFTEVAGLITAIGIGTAAPIVKFVKYGSVLNSASIKEDYTMNDNGTFDIAKELAFALNNLGLVDSKVAVENLMGQPVSALVKLNSGAWVAFGLNGQFQLKTVAGTADATSNGRILTLAGSDGALIQPVDPTIVAALLS
jgi:hypothetical protein